MLNLIENCCANSVRLNISTQYEVVRFIVHYISLPWPNYPGFLSARVTLIFYLKISENWEGLSPVYLWVSFLVPQQRRKFYAKTHHYYSNHKYEESFLKYLYFFSNGVSVVSELVTNSASQLIKMSSRPAQPRPDQTRCILNQLSSQPCLWLLRGGGAHSWMCLLKKRSLIISSTWEFWHW